MQGRVEQGDGKILFYPGVRVIVSTFLYLRLGEQGRNNPLFLSPLIPSTKQDLIDDVICTEFKL